MNKPKYVHLPNGNTYVMVGRSGSTSLCKALVNQLFPERLPLSVEPPQNFSYHNALDRVESTQGDCLFSVREPIERFRSYCAHLSIRNVDSLLDRLENSGGVYTEGFQPVTDLLGESNKLFKFPDDFSALCSAVGVSNVAVTNSQPEENKPTLTIEQVARVGAFYAADIALYESITEVGQTYTAPSTEPEPVYVPTEATNFQIKQALNVNPEDRAAVDALVAGSGDQNIIDGWEHASTFKRDNAMFIGAVALLGWTEEKVDNLFILATTFD